MSDCSVPNLRDLIFLLLAQQLELEGFRARGKRF